MPLQPVIAGRCFPAIIVSPMAITFNSRGPFAESTRSLVKLDHQGDVLQLGIRSGILKADASVIEVLQQLIF